MIRSNRLNCFESRLYSCLKPIHHKTDSSSSLLAGEAAARAAVGVDADHKIMQALVSGFDADGEMIDSSTTATRKNQQDGRCCSFDSTDDSISLPMNIVDISGDWTISGWAKLSATGNTSIIDLIDSDGDKITCGFVGSRFGCDVNISGVSSEVASGTGSNTDEWYFVTFRRDGGTLSAFRNAIDETAVVSSIGSLASSSAIRGKFKTDEIDLFDIRVWNVALTDAEIISLFKHEIVKPDDLQAWWKLDDGAGDRAYDSSGNENHGTINNQTDENFFYEGTDVPYSFQNEVGFTAGSIVDSHGAELDLYPAGDRPDGLDIEFWISNLSTSAGALASDNDTGGGYIFFNTGSTAAVANDPGSNHSTTVDGASIAHRGELYDALSDGEFHHVRVNDINVGSGDPGRFRLGRYTDTTHGAIGTIFHRVRFTDNATQTVVRDFTPDGNGNWVDSITGLTVTSTSGFSDIFIPRDESDTTKDVLGSDLHFTGRVRRNGKPMQSFCATPSQDDLHLPEDILGDDLNKLTFCCWMKTASSSGTLFSKYDAASDQRSHRAVIASSKFDVILTPVGTLTGGNYKRYRYDTTVNDGEWYHLAYAWDGTTNTLKLYVNGEEVTGSDLVITQDANFSTLHNSTHNSTDFWDVGGGSFNGSMCGAFVYTEYLSGDDIRGLMRGTLPSSTQGKIGLPMAEGAGSKVTNIFDDTQYTIDGWTESTGWGTKQDEFHWNLTKGFTKYTHASSNPIYVPYNDDGNPISITPPSGYSKDSDYPKIDGHNGAETEIDFTAGVNAPWHQWITKGWVETANATNVPNLYPSTIADAADDWEIEYEGYYTGSSQYIWNAHSNATRTISTTNVRLSTGGGSIDSNCGEDVRDAWHIYKWIHRGSVFETDMHFDGDLIETETAHVRNLNQLSAYGGGAGARAKNVKILDNENGGERHYWKLTDDHFDTTESSTKYHMTEYTKYSSARVFPLVSVETDWAFGDSRSGDKRYEDSGKYFYTFA